MLTRFRGVFVEEAKRQNDGIALIESKINVACRVIYRGLRATHLWASNFSLASAKASLARVIEG